MSAMAAPLIYLLRWGAFLLRSVLYAGYSLLEFVSKPGSCLIVPVLALAASWRYRPALESAIDKYLLALDWQRLQHLPPASLQWGAALGLALALCVYVALARHVFRIRRTLTAFAGLLRFTLRLAALLIVGGLAAAFYYDVPVNSDMAGRLVAYLNFDIAGYVPEFDWRHMQEPARIAVWALGLVLATCVYLALSRLLTLLLGAFPPVARPLRPLRRLRSKSRCVRPVAVRIAVPRLRERQTALASETVLPGLQ